MLRTELTAVTGTAGDLVCEIGCGHGHFLTAYATAHPATLCLGLDLNRERIERACRKRDRAASKNLHFLQADARLFLEVLPAELRLSVVFILFPDPWPKARHHKHRLMQPSFLDALAYHAAPDCQLCFRTDHQPYYRDTESLIRESSRWHLTDVPWPFDHETVFQQRATAFRSLMAVLKR